MFKGIFFNSIISITMEGLFEFIVYGFLNLYTINFSTNGEVLGFIIAAFCLFCVFFVIIALIWSLLTKNHDKL